MWHQGRLWLKGKILVPESSYHDSPASGHWGGSRTASMLKRSHVFTNLRRKVKAYVRSCDVCQRAKADCHLPRGHVQNLENPVKKWESISMDFVSFPPTRLTDGDREYDKILTVTDSATKMVTLIMCQSTWSAAQVAERFFWEVIRYRGVPRSIVSDRDAIFMSNFWKELMTFLDIRLRRSSPYHHQTNGQAERTNGTLKQVLRALLLERPWENWLDLTPTTFLLDIPLVLRGRASPIFHSSDLIPYETRLLDPMGMLPEDEPED